MNSKVLKTLEFGRILEQLSEEADSNPAKELIRTLEPVRDLKQIEEWQTQTADALSRLIKSGGTSFGGNSDLRYIVKSLEAGSVLSISDLLRIASQLENAGRLISYGESSGGGIASTLSSANTGTRHSVDIENGAVSETPRMISVDRI